MNTLELLKERKKEYKAIIADYRQNLVPKLDENKVQKKIMRKEIAFLGLMNKTKVHDMKPEDVQRLKEMAQKHGQEFSEGITKPEKEPSQEAPVTLEESQEEEVQQVETQPEEPASADEDDELEER